MLWINVHWHCFELIDFFPKHRANFGRCTQRWAPSPVKNIILWSRKVYNVLCCIDENIGGNCAHDCADLFPLIEIMEWVKVEDKLKVLSRVDKIWQLESFFCFLCSPMIWNCHYFTMDNVTQQMKGVTLLGNANKNDANDFNAGFYHYLLFVASNASKPVEVIDWSEADQELKTWIKQSSRLQLMADQQSERIKVLNHINFPCTTGTHQERWSMHYEE